MKIIIIIISFILMAGFGLYQMFFMAGKVSVAPEPIIINIESDAIDVKDQQPGSVVIVSSVNLIRKGYVVIHDNNSGRPGNIIGNSRILQEGTSYFVRVGLIRPAKNNETLFAVMYEDSGDGVFSPSIDTAFKSEAGDVVFKRFVISQNADIIKTVPVNQ